MTRKILTTALVLAVVLMGCGGGGSNAKLKKNKYLGNLPSICANWNATQKDYQEKWENMSNKEKNAKLKEYEKKEKELTEKFNADCTKEMENVKGNEIPITYSEALKNSEEFIYTVSASKIFFEDDSPDNPLVELTFTITKDFDNLYTNKYRTAYYREFDSKGETILYPRDIEIFSGSKLKSIAAGTALEKKRTIGFIDGHEPEKSIDFMGVEFITEQEYKALKDME